MAKRRSNYQAARSHLSRREIRRRIEAWVLADPVYFSKLKARYGKPKTK